MAITSFSKSGTGVCRSSVLLVVGRVRENMNQDPYRSSLIHGLICSLLSVGFLVLGVWYPIRYAQQYGENDFRAGEALLLSLIVGVAYGARAGWCFLHLPEHRRARESASSRQQSPQPEH